MGIGNYFTVLSQTINSDGFDVSISFSFEWQHIGNATPGFDPQMEGRARILRDGTPLQNWAFGTSRQTGVSQVVNKNVFTIVAFKDLAPPAGPHLYEVQTRIDTGNTQSQSQTITSRGLELRITKR